MEQAQVMLDLGCKWAGHLDGGGSMTYGSKPEGEDSFKIVNKPSDGSERSISNGLIVVSTAVASKVFDHVSFDVETEYATPGTPVEVSVSGVSSTGHAAEIPADITYRVTNGTYENGVLTTGAVGDVVLTATYNGNEVGSVTIHAVVPEKLMFVGSTITVPYGKTVSLNLTATYGLNEVKFKASDLLFALSDNGIGTIDGLSFTAGDGTVSTSTVTATIKGSSVSASATINLGKGSEVLWNFEDGDVSEFYRAAAANYNYLITPGSCSIVTAENGKVHSGNYAMRFNADFSVSTESGYMNGRLCVKNKSGERIDLKGATRLGMWIYFPIEAKSLNGRIFLQKVTERNEDGSIKSVDGSYTTATLIDNGGDWDCGFTMEYDEPGWHYVYFDLEGGDWCIPANWTMLDFYVNDRDGSKHGYNHFEHKSQNVNVIMYLDDITVDYSSAVDDRDAPAFSDVRWASTSMSDAVSFIRGKVAESTDNNISFGAMVADLVKDNATGLDESTAKAYVDGVEVACTIKGGVMSVADCVLADGVHTVKFEICDKQGNRASVIRQINIKANSGISTVKLAAHDATLNNILLGSVYYIDLVATDIEKVQSVSADIDLNNISKWELDHMEVAEGFTASYVISDADENIATVTVTRTGKNDATGEGMLVSMPVRTWELPAIVADGTRNNVWMYPEYRKGNEIWPIDIRASVVRGEVEFVDGTTDTFTGAEVQVDTEAHYWTNETKPADYATWNGGHDHRAETKQYYSATATNHVDAVALPDKAATCTEAGYTGRTFCEVCNSVVDWGTTIPATGHEYELIDGQFVCKKCSDVYDAGSGLFEMNGTYYYAVGGVLQTGWIEIDGAWHYFGKDYAAVTGEYYYASRGITYQFDETGKTNGVWQKTKYGTRFWYGQWYYTARNEYQKQFVEIDGKTYNFDVNGYMCTGIHALYDDWSSLMRGEMQVWEFDDDGSLIKQITDKGIVDNKRGGLYLIEEDGYVHGGTAHLVSYNGDLYFVCYSGKLKQNGHQQITAANSNNLVKPGVYEFGADGKMLPLFTGVRADETGTLYYYKDGAVCSGIYNSELVEIDGSVYLVKWSGKVAANETRTVLAEKTNGLVDAGVYNFGADGKLIPPVTEVKDNGNGILYYYRDGKIVSAEYDSELVEINGAIYLVKWSGKVAVNETLYIANSKANGLMKSGYYSFDSDGKLILPFTGVKDDGTGTLYYYENGIVRSGVYNSELVDIGGFIYFVKWSGKVASNEYRTVTAKISHGLLPDGRYYFGADGKLVSEK